MRKVYGRDYSPEKITQLHDGEVFVFSCGTDGYFHTGSSLHKAAKGFGDFKDGKRTEWVTERTYAIPCEILNATKQTECLAKMKDNITKFITFAKGHPQKRFLVTPIANGGIFKFKPYHIAPLFEDALTLENVLLPQEFVEHLEMQAGRPVVNTLVLSSNEKYDELYREKFSSGFIRTVKTIRYSSELETLAKTISQNKNLWSSIDAVIFDPSVREKSDNDEPYSGLETVLTIEKAINYAFTLPFFCLATEDGKTVREKCGLSEKKIERIRFYTMDKSAELRETLLRIDSADSRLRSEHIVLFKAAEWFDGKSTDNNTDGKETACEFISSVLLDNTDNIVNRARSFRDKILDVLVTNNVLPLIGDKNISYGAIVDFIRKGHYDGTDYYLLEAGHVLPKGLRFMFEAIKENGNAASHSTTVLDDYITRSVFYAFCSLLLWLHQNKNEIEAGKMVCYGTNDPNAANGWQPKEGIVEAVKTGQKDYFYCEGVHLSDNRQTPEKGRRIRINSVGPEQRPQVLGVLLFSNDWEYLK